MITHALQITVFVKDLDETKTFYTEKLGFIVCNDEEFEPGWRFLTVAPSKNNETVLELANANSPEQKALMENKPPVRLWLCLPRMTSKKTTGK